jgi:hypothetical protein
VKKLLLAGVAALSVLTTSAAHPGDPPDPETTIEIFLEGAKRQPDFRQYHTCQPVNAGCQTIATSTRMHIGRYGYPEPEGRDTFIRHDGDKQKTWCYQHLVGAGSHTRICQVPDPAAERGMRIWTEAYYPAAKFWRKIPVSPYNSACSHLQMSKYSVDDAYADCVVNNDPDETNARQAEAERQAEERRKAEEKVAAEAKARAGIEQDCLKINGWRFGINAQRVCHNAAQAIANPLATPRLR